MSIKWRKGLDIDLDVDHSKKKFIIDWESWLNEVGSDTISSVASEITPDILITGLSNTDTTTSFTIEADPSAVVGDIGSATIIITTVGGQTEPRSILFNLVNDL